MTTKEKQADLYNKLSQQWGTFLGVINKIEDTERKEACKQLAEKLHDRLIVCPASTKIEFTGAFPGGLVWHSLNVLANLKKLRTALAVEDCVSVDSIITLGLFHDIGKLGTEEEDYYLPQNSDWHRDKLGQMFITNDELSSTSVSSRTLFWLNTYGIKLTAEEIEAITSINSKSGNETVVVSQSFKDSWLTFLLQTAVKGACLNSTRALSLLDV